MSVFETAPSICHNGGPPLDDDVLLTRNQVAEALTRAGFPISPNTLRTLACRGGGPEYHLFGRNTLYRWGTSRIWANSRLSPPRRNTSEADAKRAA